MASPNKAKEYLENAFSYVAKELLEVTDPDLIEMKLEELTNEILDERAGVSFESDMDLEEDEDD